MPTPAHPFSPAGRADPHPGYRRLRESAPVHFDETTAMWLLTGHAGCAAALRDPGFSARLGQRERARDDDLPPSMLTTDPPDHGRLRAPGMLLLGPAAVRDMTAAIDAEVDEILAGLAAGGRDLDATGDIGEPLATAVLARMLGIPDGERPAFAALARRAAVNLNPLAPPPVAAAGRAAMGDLTRFLRDVEPAAGSPAARFAADDRLTPSERLGVLSLAVVGGWQPLAETVGNGLYLLLARPGALGTLQDEATARTAIDELLRLEAPIPFTARVTTQPVELSGRRIPAGARVLAVIAAANRDPAVFARPDDLDVTRSPNPHLAFAAGPHFCLGAPLVRHAGAALLHRLAARFPRVRQAGPEPRWAPTLVPRRLRGLRIDLGRPQPTRA